MLWWLSLSIYLCTGFWLQGEIKKRGAIVAVTCSVVLVFLVFQSLQQLPFWESPVPSVGVQPPNPPLELPEVVPAKQCSTLVEKLKDLKVLRQEFGRNFLKGRNNPVEAERAAWLCDYGTRLMRKLDEVSREYTDCPQAKKVAEETVGKGLLTDMNEEYSSREPLINSII